MEHPAIWDDAFMLNYLGVYGYTWGEGAHWSGWTFDSVVEYAFRNRGSGFCRWDTDTTYGYVNGDGRGGSR